MILICGIDEVGRGSIAGPVVVASVILNPIFLFNPSLLSKIQDSKTLNKKSREESYLQIINKFAIAYAFVFVDNFVVDEINVLQASLIGMMASYQKMVEDFKIVPDKIIVDGNQKPKIDFQNLFAIPKADSIDKNVAAASILAKVERDNFMLRLHFENPNYDWDKNFGYPTKSHKNAIKKLGINKHHRLSFKIS